MKRSWILTVPRRGIIRYGYSLVFSLEAPDKLQNRIQINSQILENRSTTERQANNHNSSFSVCFVAQQTIIWDSSSGLV